MSILTYLKKVLGIRKEPPLTEPEIYLLTQLQANRKTALEQVIPASMRDEFIHSVYPDSQLVFFVKDIYRNILVEDLRKTYLENAIRLSLSVKSFGRNLIIYHRIDPEVIAQIMLRRISL